MTESAVSLEIDGRVAVVTLIRPERRNALDAEVCTQLTTALEDATSGGAVRAVLLRGEGPAFCAGANLKGGVYADNFFAALERMLTTVTDLPVPVIADIQGPAVGAGCQLALACDLRVAGAGARIWIPAVHHGFALDAWTVQRAVELLGGSTARNMLVAGVQVDQTAALTCGFATLSGTSADALAFAHRVAAQAPLSTAWFKRALNHPGAPGLTEEAAACWASRDVREARDARDNNRAPVFEGR
ncbi:enoyl-CoA hydratase [uncultured Corynebacterium sp.]|uniref:enoyl-CoA hydratase n=1 Tax=uncultured Corynebacterium sp. TaxID=159447 RepID=UPI0025D4AC65|nr:enoyl-CoA hydratase [uncultured Corynebacterium sp.]